MSTDVTALSLISQSDLNLDGDEPRVSHHVLADRMGVGAGNIKRVINTLVSEDEYFGALVTSAERLAAGMGSSVREHVMLTEAGKRYGEAVPFANGKHAGNQLLWSREVLEALR